jgi:hypothetical protein
MKAPENEISDQSCDNGTLGTLGTGSKPRRNLPGKIVQMVHDARNLSMDKKIAEDISHLNEPSKEGE